MASVEPKKLFTVMFLILETMISRATSDTPLEFSVEESQLAERYEIWLSQYGRKYINSEDQEKRFNIFKDNVAYIDKFNSEGNRPYKLAANKFADITHEEFLATYTGKKNSSSLPPGALDPKSFKRNSLNAVPDFVDWRDIGAVTAVRNQGDDCPKSGWAFATVAGMEGLLKRITNNLEELSLQQLIDCSPAGNCNGGFAARAYTYVRDNNGIALEEYYPFHQSQGTCDKQKELLHVFKIGGCYAGQGNEQLLHDGVATNPVSIEIDASTREFQLYGGGIYTGPCGFNTNHDVTAVGYDTSPEGTQYWILKNSWGTGWGEEGYMRIRRNNPGGGLCGLASQISWPFE